MASITFSALLKRLNFKAEEKIHAVRKSISWFKERAHEVRIGAINTTTTVKPEKIIHDEKAMQLPITRLPISTNADENSFIGRMLFYLYDPKTKDKMPYYDIYPLIFVLRLDRDGFMGLNMHYLPPALRAILMDALYTLINNKEINEQTRLKLSYRILTESSRFDYFKPCLKKYLYTQIRSRFMLIKPENWDAVLMLPLASFKKKTENYVWNESRTTINEGRRSSRKPRK